MTAPAHPLDCRCTAHPLPASLRVRDALDAYLAENGFTHAEYEAKWTPASLLGVPLAVPNTPLHKRGIRLHDLHHIATGYGTDLAGEGEISAWEVRGGFHGLDLYVSSLVALGTATGALFSPLRAWAALVSSNRRNLFDAWSDYPRLLEMTVGELRERLGVPPAGLGGARKLHSRAPRTPPASPARAA